MTDTRDGDVRVASRSVPGTDLIVVSTSPYASLYADVDRTRLNLLATVGPLLVFLVALSLAFSRRMANANRRLHVAGIASAHLASIVESADDAIIGVDADGRVTSWNTAAAEMYGLEAADIVGKRLDAGMAGPVDVLVQELDGRDAVVVTLGDDARSEG